MDRNTDNETVVTATEARQGRITGVYKILFASLLLAVLAGIVIAIYLGTAT
jgi:hypothetical protein